jgi:DNA replication licensing factor MCM7
MDGLMPESEVLPDEASDPLELIIFQRRQRDAMRDETDRTNFPKVLTRKFSVFFKAPSSMEAVSIRQVKGDAIGHMVKVRGMVTRVGNVKPLATVIGYSCDKCGFESFQEVTASVWSPLFQCPSEDCKKNATKGALYMQTRASKFIKFQEVKLQELADQVPMGHIPRSMTVHLAEDLTRTLNPGDSVILSGIFLPVPFTGFKAIRAGLITDTFLATHHVDKMKKSYAQMVVTKVKNKCSRSNGQ